MSSISPPNESTLNTIYNMEVATNLLRTYIVTQDKTDANAEIVSIILAATALQNTMNNTSNWSNLP